MKKISSVIHYH